MSSSTFALPLRIFITALLLVAVAWSAWKSIPPKQIALTEKQMETNRLLAIQARLISLPSSISEGYTISDQGVQLKRGGSIVYTIKRSDGFLRGVFQVENIDGGEIQIKAEGGEHSMVCLERKLNPSSDDVDRGVFHFLIRLDALPPGTKQLILRTTAGTINWRETGFIDGREYDGFERIPVQFVAADGFLPYLDGKNLQLQSPARLIFRTPAGKHRLTLRYGPNPALFNDPKADSDGIGFKVELIGQGKNQELLNQILEPFSKPADRVIRSTSLSFESPVPALLALTATPGAGSNISWDWSVWENLHLDDASP